MKKWFWLLAITLCHVLTTSAQTKYPQVGAIATARGLLLYFNEPGTYFTIELPGKHIEVIDAPQKFKIDSLNVQFYFVRKQNLAMPNKAPDSQHLEAYQLREIAYIESELNEPVVVKQCMQTIGTQNFLVWSCKNPDKYIQQALEEKSVPIIWQYSYTTLCNDMIISFTSPQRLGTSPNIITCLLKNISSSLKIYNEEIDITMLLRFIKSNDF